MICKNEAAELVRKFADEIENRPCSLLTLGMFCCDLNGGITNAGLVDVCCASLSDITEPIQCKIVW